MHQLLSTIQNDFPMVKLTGTIHKMLDILSAAGSSGSINQLAKKIEERYGFLNYAQVNKQIHLLAANKIINLINVGKSLIVVLNFKNPQTLNLLAEMELQKKNRLTQEYSQEGTLLDRIERRSMKFHFIHSIALIRPQKHISLNRLELLVIFKPKEIDRNWDIADDSHLLREKKIFRSIIQRETRRNNIRIDFLLLDRKEFLRFLQSDEINQVKEMMMNKILIANARAFWSEVSEIQEAGIHLANYYISEEETNPYDINEEDIIYNLARFGYREFGTRIEKGKEISIEYIIVAILMKGDARRMEAIPSLMTKNEASLNYELLAFLCNKYQVMDKLSPLLTTDSKKNYSIEDKMRLYDDYTGYA